MRDSFRDFPPYEGDGPYLYFAFAEADSKKVREYMRLLYERGCRVWYSRGKADGPEEVLRRQARYRGAALTMVYLSDEACKDQNTKSSVLVNQKFDSPIVCLDPDGKDRLLAMGLRESVPRIPLYRLRSGSGGTVSFPSCRWFSARWLWSCRCYSLRESGRASQKSSSLRMKWSCATRFFYLL